MSAIAVLAEDRSQSRWSSVADNLLLPPMQHSLLEIKEKLVKALDKDNNVVDLVGVMEVITLLEKAQITKEALEKTRLGKYINEIRKKTTSDKLAKRAKELVRSWRKLILPHDCVVNGERSNCGPYPVSSGPSWNAVHPGKPTSPATTNHKNLRATSPVTVGSPISWHCSSTSTSPALGPLHSGSRPSTPSLAAQRGSPVPNDVAHHSSSSAVHLNSAGSKCHSPHEVAVERSNAHHHGRWGASPPKSKNEFQKLPALHRVKSTSPGLNSEKVARLSHSSSTELVDRTNAANKRLRKEQRGGVDCDASRSSKRPCMDSGEPSGLVEVTNGLDSGEGSHSPHEQRCDTTTQVPSSDSFPISKRQSDVKNSKVRHDKSDSLKEKIASHARTPKVKTTQQLIAELKARNTVSVNFTTAVSPSLPPQLPHTSPYARRPAGSVLNNDHELTKTKSELLEKFLQATTSSASYSDDPSAAASCSSHHHHESSVGTSGVDPVDEILSRLPPIDCEAIDWNQDVVDGDVDDDDDDHPQPKKECTDEDVDRVITQQWEGVNGNFDHQHKFREWNEALSCISYEGDLLHILPYVNID